MTGTQVPPGPIVFACSVLFEAESLLRRMPDAAPLELRHRSAWRGTVAGRDAIVLVGGMGKTNAAQSVTMLLERLSVARLVSFGIAGAYPQSDLAVGDVALAASEHYGDDGVDSPAGWLSCEGIGIPLVETNGGRHFNDFPADPVVVDVAAAFRRAGRKVAVGPFVTVSCCSGTAARGAVLAERFGAICESMEGAAHAHVAALYGLPFLELRGISNLVEDRDLGRWRIADAAEAAASAIPLLIASWDDS